MLKSNQNKMSKAAVKTTTTPKPASTKAATKVAKREVEAPAPAPEPAPVEASAETSVETVSTTVPLRERFEALVKSKTEQIAQLKTEIVELRKLSKDHEAALRALTKKGKRSKTNADGTPRKPSGFASPVVVSDELYAFLSKSGIKKGEPIARTDVTRHITAYIKQHDLQNPENRREILADATLKGLFGPPQELKDSANPNGQKMYSYMGMQRYLSRHFPKKAVVAQ